MEERGMRLVVTPRTSWLGVRGGKMRVPITSLLQRELWELRGLRVRCLLKGAQRWLHGGGSL